MSNKSSLLWSGLLLARVDLVAWCSNEGDCSELRHRHRRHKRHHRKYRNKRDIRQNVHRNNMHRNNQNIHRNNIEKQFVRNGNVSQTQSSIKSKHNNIIHRTTTPNVSVGTILQVTQPLQPPTTTMYHHQQERSYQHVRHWQLVLRHHPHHMKRDTEFFGSSKKWRGV